LIEGLVGVLAMIAASAMHPGDFYAINTSPAVYQTLGLQPVNLAGLEAAVGESVTGRTGGATSLAVGMAQIFSALPGMSGLLAYWYHFAIMFEALFILTTIDAGTRIGRFLLQEFLGRAWKPFANPAWVPGSVISTSLIVLGWGYFIYAGSISTIWPAFAVANQLLASVALVTATTILIKMGKAGYSWVTAGPLVFLFTNTMWGGFLNIRDNYWPLATGPNPATHLQGYLLAVLTVIMMVCAVFILGAAIAKWVALLSGNGREPVPAES